MYNKLPLIALLLSTAACSVEQKPAPYVDRSSEKFNRSGGSSYSGYPTPVYNNTDYIDASDDISSEKIESKSLMPADNFQPAPINRNDAVIDFADKSQTIQKTDYIDAPQTTTLAPTSPVASKSFSRPKPVLDEQPQLAQTTSTPNKTGYLDLGAVNNFNGSTTPAPTIQPANMVDAKPAGKLLRAKPLAKPSYKPSTEPTQTIAAEPAQPQAEVATETAPSTATAIAIPANPTEAKPAPAQTVEHTTKLSEHESVTTTKTIERVDSKPATPAANAKAGEEAIEKAPIVEKKKEAKSDSGQFLRPVAGKIVGKFGNDEDGTFNDGIKIKAEKGTSVKAADGGEVVYSGNQLAGYGNMIIIRHPSGYLTSYAHLENLNIKKGTKISKGDAIGTVGDTGNVSEPMLHFGVREGREPVDPQKFLK